MLHLPDDYPERVRWQKNPEHRKTLEFYAWFISGCEAARILDLGAGPGTVAIPLSRLENVTDVVCLERDEGARKTLEAIKESEGIAKIQITGEGEPWDLPFASQSFDAVVCRYAMHHFKDQQGTLREIARCLKGDGLLLYSDPAMPEHSRNTTHGLYLIREKSFFGYNTYHEITDRVSSAGLEILAVRPYDYQRGTLEDYLKDSEPDVKEHLVRAWLGLDEQTKHELKWSGQEAGPFITYPVLDVAARKPI